jgi:hypothetical protein
MAPGGWYGETRKGRREPRVVVDLAATLVGRATHSGRVVDLSLMGCLLRSEAPLDGGAVVDLRVELPDGGLRTKARVAEASLDGDSLPAGRQQFLAGLEFLGLAAADELRLRRFVAAESRRRKGAHAAPP